MQTVSTYFNNRLHRFKSDQEGSVAIEAVIILPILFWAYLSMFAIFDAYRQYTVNQKAAYTISDLMSRQTNPIDIDFLDSSRALFDMLTRSKEESSMRLTVVIYDEASDSFSVRWSKHRGSFTALEDVNVASWHDKLPVMPDQENVIIVETQSSYDPPFNTGLEDRVIKNFVFTRPRYAPQILWQN